MFTFFAYTLGSFAMGSGLLEPLLFWALTAFVIWGFVDLVVTPASRFESAHHPLALWILAFVFFGPVASVAWLTVRSKVKNAPLPPPRLGPPVAPYPFEQPPPYVPPHLEASHQDDGGPPPLR